NQWVTQRCTRFTLKKARLLQKCPANPLIRPEEVKKALTCSIRAREGSFGTFGSGGPPPRLTSGSYRSADAVGRASGHRGLDCRARSRLVGDGLHVGSAGNSARCALSCYPSWHATQGGGFFIS